MLYLNIIKDIYECIESYLLSYHPYVNNLKVLGFITNPYNQYILNKIINGKQCKICWYVDDNKVSHVDSKVNTMVIAAIAKHFGGLLNTSAMVIIRDRIITIAFLW